MGKENKKSTALSYIVSYDHQTVTEQKVTTLQFTSTLPLESHLLIEIGSEMETDKQKTSKTPYVLPLCQYSYKSWSLLFLNILNRLTKQFYFCKNNPSNKGQFFICLKENMLEIFFYIYVYI